MSKHSPVADLLTGSTMAGNNTMTGTATIASNPLNIATSEGYSIQVVWTGTATGTFKLQGSNDLDTTQAGGSASISNWTDINGTSSAVSAAGNQMWNVQGAYYKWVRLSYTNATNTGTISSVSALAKGN